MFQPGVRLYNINFPNDFLAAFLVHLTLVIPFEMFVHREIDSVLTRVEHNLDYVAMATSIVPQASNLSNIRPAAAFCLL